MLSVALPPITLAVPRSVVPSKKAAWSVLVLLPPKTLTLALSVTDCPKTLTLAGVEVSVVYDAAGTIFDRLKTNLERAFINERSVERLAVDEVGSKSTVPEK